MSEDTGHTPTDPNNRPPWPPHLNRETRRKCARTGHDAIKTIDGITACVKCGMVIAEVL